MLVIIHNALSVVKISKTTIFQIILAIIFM